MLISLAWEAGASGNPASSSNLSHRITVGCLAAFFFFCAQKKKLFLVFYRLR